MTTMAAWDYAHAEMVAIGCPLCGASLPSRPVTDRFGFVLGVSTCPACDLGYLNPRMTAAEYGRFYREAYRPLLETIYGPALYDAHEQRFAEWRGAQAGRWLRQTTRSARSLVDVGGDTGVVALAAARGLGCSDVTVIDPNTAALRQAAARGCQTIEGLIDQLPVPDRQWDVALCLFTADHWLDPLAALRWIRAAVGVGGRLCVDIVNVQAWYRHRTDTYWKVDHPLAWTAASFQRALQQTGWRVDAEYVRPGSTRKRPNFLCTGV